MWDHGSINGDNVQQVDPGDMHVHGDIDSHSFVFLVSTGGSIIVDGKIDGGSMVIFVSSAGAITIGGKIDGDSNVSLKAKGNVTIGTQGAEGDKKIDGRSQVSVEAGGNITLGSYVHKATADFKAHGEISVSEIDYDATVRQTADGDILVFGKIDGTSRVDLVSNRGSVRIYGKIDGESRVSLTSRQDVGIGFDANLGDGDRKIDGNCLVTAIAGGSISVGGGIFKDHTTVDFAAASGIAIGTSISGGPFVRLLAASGQITVTGGISDNGTVVIYFPPGALVANINGAPQVNEGKWAEPDTLSLAVERAGYWWENWPQTFGYVAPFRAVPRSLDDIAGAILAFGHGPVKALGGGFSFSDAVLPFQTQQEVDNASILLRGMWQRQDMRHVLEGLNDIRAEPMDLLPQAVGRNLTFSTAYNQAQLLQVTNSGAQLPSTQKVVGLIDTRSLASSLQCEFRDMQVVSGAVPAILFHVEAGITTADLQQLLDHQKPRLAIQWNSAGPAGATLAGVLSTATHGAEFRAPLPADTVRAVHLVGPGGEQWWIEGDAAVVDQKKLQQRYPKIDQAHFIGKGWKGIPGLTAQDVLDAVTVSMGTMGVIYSVVLEVVPQFGLRQVVHPTTWQDVLTAAKVAAQDLHAGDAGANQAVLKALLDGDGNGTGIKEKDNVYANLRINPFNFDCWVLNQEVTPNLPDDANNPSPDYLTALSRAIARSARDNVQDSLVLGRIFDFLSWATDVGGGSPNISDVVNDVAQATRLASFITGLGDALSGTLAAASVQTVANVINVFNQWDRGQKFLGDVVSGLFHALHGTGPGQNSDRTAVSYKVGAIGWPGGGAPGRGLEIALDPTNAFTFLQRELFEDVLHTFMSDISNPLKPLIGFISIRVCPTTKTLMGMQQYSPNSVMLEVGGYRSPEANDLMHLIQTKALNFATPGPKPLLHWGFENDQLTGAYLTGTPLGKPYKGNLTRLEAFTEIRNYLKKGHPPVFDNNFSKRLGL